MNPPRLWGLLGRVPRTLDFVRKDVVGAAAPRATRKMSISGAQPKVSLRLVDGRLEPAETGGEFILKPAPLGLVRDFDSEVPANENLTMRLAAGVFGISAAENGCVRFADGEPAYLTRRFDIRHGAKVAQEDFAQIAGRDAATGGENFQYSASYEELGEILRSCCAAYPVEVRKLFRQLVFDYVFSNGDAHLKNFSVFESADGDRVLTPAYDLMSTTLHNPGETRIAFDDQPESPVESHFFKDGFMTDFYKANRFYGRADFLELARRFGIDAAFATRTLDLFAARASAVSAAVAVSLLTPPARARYLALFADRLRALE